MDTLLQDLRYAFRMLRRTPAVTAVAIITLALGIGANTAIFSVLRGMLWRPLPYQEAGRAAMIWSHWIGWDQTWVSAPEYHDYAAETQIFASVGAYTTTAATLTGVEGGAERIAAGLLTASLWDALGARAVLGRTFTADEDQPGAGDVVVVGEGLWRRRLSADPGIVGRSIQLNGRPHTVVGIMPEAFRLPDDFASEERTQLWAPLRLGPVNPNNRGNHGLLAVARIRDGVTLERAESGLDALTARMRRDYAQNYDSTFGANLVTLPDEVFGDVKPALMVLLGAVALVLLIACGNVANLLLARGEARQRELAIRTALGAGRRRMVRQLLTESLVLALIGGAAGALLATWGVQAIPAINPSSLPRAEAIAVDGVVLLATLGIALATGLVFGMVPAWQLARMDVQPELRDNARSVTTGAAGQKFRRLLISAQVALAVVLVVGAGLLMRSFARLTAVSPGFDPANVLTMRLSLPAAAYPTRTSMRNFYDRLFTELRALPGVDLVGAVTGLPLTGPRGDWGTTIEGYTPPPNQGTPVDWQIASADYFRALGIPLVKGRYLSEADREGSAPVILINEAAARRYWEGRDPVGLRMRINSSADTVWRTVVGIVGDVRHRGLALTAKPEMYWPQSQVFVTAGDSVTIGRTMTVTVRTRGAPLALAAAVRRVVTTLDPALAVSDVRSLDDVVSRSVAAPRFTATLIGVFALLALTLAAAGIYGVVAYVVAQRTAELGIRVALGARVPDVLRLVVGQGMRPVGIGLLAGLAGALLLSRTLSRLLYEVAPTDVLTYAIVAALLGGVALLACYLPARRAARVDPMIALRAE